MCFYKALNSFTIVGPTCGIGAFLFALINIFEPLCQSCIGTMEKFVNSLLSGEMCKGQRGRHKYFEDTLHKIKSPAHPNLQYFIYKTLLCCLYGVDIKKAAVEIAKLRLFLKLAATADANYSWPN